MYPPHIINFCFCISILILKYQIIIYIFNNDLGLNYIISLYSSMSVELKTQISAVFLPNKIVLHNIKCIKKKMYKE